jgi:hypothetical protein
MTHRLARWCWGLIGLGAWLSGAAQAVCPAPHQISPEQLHGHWTVQVTGQPRMWLLQLGPHPEHQGSLSGQVDTGAQRYPVVADLEDGELTLEESHDGEHIAATWLGVLTPNGCGQTLTGQRQPEQGTATPFVMRRNQAR